MRVEREQKFQVIIINVHSGHQFNNKNITFYFLNNNPNAKLSSIIFKFSLVYLYSLIVDQ